MKPRVKPTFPYFGPLSTDELEKPKSGKLIAGAKPLFPHVGSPCADTTVEGITCFLMENGGEGVTMCKELTRKGMTFKQVHWCTEYASFINCGNWRLEMALQN
jgi:hypothetical protein